MRRFYAYVSRRVLGSYICSGALQILYIVSKHKTSLVDNYYNRGTE